MVKRCADDPDACSPRPGCAQVLAVGQSLPFRARAARCRCRSTCRARSRSCSSNATLDFVHVHEPFAPERRVGGAAPLARAQRRHVPLDHRAAALDPGRRARSSSCCSAASTAAPPASPPRATSIERYFPGDYRVIRPGRRPGAAARSARSDETAEIVFSAEEERGALRLFLRALRKLPDELDWHATIWLARPGARARRAAAAAAPRPGPLRRARQTAPRRSTWPRATSSWPPRAAPRPRPSSCCAPLAGGAVPVASRLPQYEEALRRRASSACCSSRATRDTLAAQLERLVARRPRSARTLTAAHGRGARRSSTGRAWPTSSRSSTRRSPRAATTRTASRAVRKRLAGRDFIHVDLHMHTDHSPDCATPVDTLLETARERGPRRDRGHRPQRDLGRARGARAGQRASR